MDCPSCEKKGIKSPMRVTYKDQHIVLWKCPMCGHLTMIQNSGAKRQDWGRDEV